MSKKSYGFQECVEYCGFDNLPDGLEQFYNQYLPQEQVPFIEQKFMESIYERFDLPQHCCQRLWKALKAVEADPILRHFSSFLVWDMCSARNRCDVDNYNSMTPICMKEEKELYSFLLLLACVVPSMKLLKEREVPEHYYKHIPYQPMKHQLEKLVRGDVVVSDFPWDMNFYTCSIFLLDRFLFIPYRFGDEFTMYRHKDTNQVIALRHAGDEFRRDGQINGINEVYDNEGKFTSVWYETEEKITANPINPMGFVECNSITISKDEWKIALKQGDTLLALHVPSGPGYTPERLKNSMMLALEFYDSHFPELKIRGFWSESWLYDSRLSLILDHESSNIIKVQRQFYLYPIHEGDGMLRYEAFGDWKADPDKMELKTSLQKAAASYMRTGARFNTLSMVVLREEADKTDQMPYITQEDIKKFGQIVDTHLTGGGPVHGKIFT